MIKIFGAGRGKKAEKASDAKGGGKEESNPSGLSNKKQPGEIRIQKELNELELPAQVKISFPNDNDLMNFKIHIAPDEGYWKGGTYQFSFTILPLYPHDAPKVLCETKVYHPNIDLQGKICLNILREDWKPVLSISSVVYGLLYLFLQPNPLDPLNQDAASRLRDDKANFARTVAQTLRGGSVNGETFPRMVQGRY